MIFCKISGKELQPSPYLLAPLVKISENPLNRLIFSSISIILH